MVGSLYCIFPFIFHSIYITSSKVEKHKFLVTPPPTSKLKTVKLNFSHVQVLLYSFGFFFLNNQSLPSLLHDPPSETPWVPPLVHKTPNRGLGWTGIKATQISWSEITMKTKHEKFKGVLRGKNF